MARTTDTLDSHTSASIQHVASELEQLAARLKAAALLLDSEPKIASVEVRYERSMNDGRTFLTNWVNEVARTVSEARFAAVKAPPNGSVSAKSDTPPKRGQNEKKSRQ